MMTTELWNYNSETNAQNYKVRLYNTIRTPETLNEFPKISISLIYKKNIPENQMQLIIIPNLNGDLEWAVRNHLVMIYEFRNLNTS